MLLFFLWMALCIFVLPILVTVVEDSQIIKKLIIRHHCQENKKSAFRIARRYTYWKAFCDTIKTKSLEPYTLKMSASKIINMFNISELNLEACLVSKFCQDIVDNNGCLVIYTWKKGQEDSVTHWFNSDWLREKGGLILFAPESYREYRKLCDYFTKREAEETNDAVSTTQMESLKYLSGLINDIQDRNLNTLKKCQQEMDSSIRIYQAQEPYFRNKH